MKNIEKHYHDYVIMWLRASNQFLITDAKDAKNQKQIDTIEEKISEGYKEIKQHSYSEESVIYPENFKYRNFYKLNGNLLAIYFESEELQTLINPKFNHLIVDAFPIEADSYFVYRKAQKVFLAHKNKVLFYYDLHQLHELSGKISMQILNTAYNSCDEDWLAVFHASFVSKENKGVLIIGDSGSGKSTAAAVLMAKGMNMIADDFVPLNLNQRVNFFPAAISIKESVEDEISNLFPELNDELVYKSSSKDINVKYLKPREEFYNTDFEISAVISIKYDPAIDFEMSKLSRNDFISKIIPDTWTSSIPENVNKFMDWIIQVPAYELNYSNNDKLVKGVTNLLDNEL